MIRNIRNIIWVALLALPIFLSAQEKEHSAKQQKKFDHYFFEASRLMSIERYKDAMEAYLECYKIDPTNATINFQLGKLYLAGNDQEKGGKYFAEAYRLDPENKWIGIALAQYYQQSGQIDQAILVYAALAKVHPHEVDFQFELAKLYYEQKQYKQCLNVLNDLEMVMGITPELSNQKKDIYLLLDDENGARKELEKLVQAFPMSIEYMGALAQFYAANGYTDAAIRTYNQMLELEPNDPRAHMDLANIYRKNENFDKSVYHLKIAMASTQLDVDMKMKVIYSFLEEGKRDSTMFALGEELVQMSIEATPNEPKLYALYGDFKLYKEDVEGARNSYRKATRLGANDAPIWSQLLFLDAELQWHDTLVVDAEEFIELYPNMPLGYLMAGSGYYFQNNHRKSIELYEAGLDFVIDNPELEEQFYVSLADSYYRLKKYKESDGYFDKALEIDPNNPTVLNNYAYYLSVRGVRLQDALEMAARCDKLVPNNPTFQDTYAWALYMNGMFDDALLYIEECAKNGGATSGEVLTHWGDILFKLNRVEEAVAKWKEAAQKDDAPQGIEQKIKNQSLHD